MRLVTKLVILGAAAYGAKVAYDKYVAAGAQSDDMAASGANPSGSSVRIGYDTPTGTDPAARYSTPGYEDKSFGQAVNEDQALVERLVNDSGGDLDGAEDAFRRASAGAPAIERQQRDAEE
jgi:hypothetical protein